MGEFGEESGWCSRKWDGSICIQHLQSSQKTLGCSIPNLFSVGGIIPNPRFVMICGSGELAAMGGERGNKSLWKIVSETCSALQLMKILGCLISSQKKGPLDP